MNFRGRSTIGLLLIGVLCACGAGGPDAVAPEEAEAIAEEA
ncbi:MAG: hypothetical protein P8127_01855 [Acidobacteriota bacterium]|jgi:hypothetical protein